MRLIFRGALWLRSLYLFTILMGVVTFVGMFREGDRGFALYIPLIFILLGYLAWPRAIRLDNEEICKRDALFRSTRIRRGEIASVVLDRSTGELVVFGQNGKRIAYNNFGDGGVKMMEQLEVLTGKETTFLGF